MRSLDRKLANIRGGNYKPDDFIIADAKDGDIGFGRALVPDPRRRSGTSRRARRISRTIRDMTKSGLVDIMLMSASTGGAAVERRDCSREARSRRRSA